MNNFLGYQCSLCGKNYAEDEAQYVCPQDGGNLDILLDIVSIRKNYAPEDIISGTEPSLWRYLPLLPVDEPGGSGTPFRAAGWTPLYSPSALKKSLT